MEICTSVEYYPRKSDIISILNRKPYIVASRRSDRLLQNLLKNDYPILFEGLHTTYYLEHPALRNRKKFVRTHNIEDRYYRNLARAEGNIFRKAFFLVESVKLKLYEKVLSGSQLIFAINENENVYFNNIFDNSIYLPPFHPFKSPQCEKGLGEYILFHADLNIRGNQEIAEFLMNRIFPNLNSNCIIAGKNPPSSMNLAAKKFQNVKIVSDPDIPEMETLIKKAQCLILFANDSEGFKIKLLYGLFSGRHCIANSIMVQNTNLRKLCIIADNEHELINLLKDLMTVTVSDEIIELRKLLLESEFSNRNNCNLLINSIYNS
jgi:hypothetical protein